MPNALSIKLPNGTISNRFGMLKTCAHPSLFMLSNFNGFYGQNMLARARTVMKMNIIRKIAIKSKKNNEFADELRLCQVNL